MARKQKVLDAKDLQRIRVQTEPRGQLLPTGQAQSLQSLQPSAERCLRSKYRSALCWRRVGQTDPLQNSWEVSDKVGQVGSFPSCLQ